MDSGWIVPKYLKNRWRLEIGDVKDLLRPLLAKLGEIDFFLHDSHHSYEHMKWEYETVWRFLCSGGLFMSHDVGANNAFLEFMKEQKISWKNYRVFHVLGGFRKP